MQARDAWWTDDSGKRILVNKYVGMQSLETLWGNKTDFNENGFWNVKGTDVACDCGM
jgi:hypothetical protein